ncbi:MAG: META domain-containing protein [Betaproteobacteria bacterium]
MSTMMIRRSNRNNPERDCSTMMFQHPHLVRLTILAIIAAAALMLLFPRSAAFAAPAMAAYTGELPAVSGAAPRIELRLKADGSMSMMSDYRNNRAPVTEDGRWNPISVEQIDVIIERKDGMAVAPRTLHFVKQGGVLQLTAESAAELGVQGLQLRQAKKQSAAAATMPVLGTVNASGVWRWESLVSATERLSIDRPERYTLELQTGEKALVRADCNRGQGAYKFEGRTIAIKLPRMPRAACPAGSLSDRYVKALETAVGQRIKGDTLFLDLPGEGGTMKFARVR